MGGERKNAPTVSHACNVCHKRFPNDKVLAHLYAHIDVITEAYIAAGGNPEDET